MKSEIAKDRNAKRDAERKRKFTIQKFTQSVEENEKVLPEHNLNANPFPLDRLLFKKLFIQKASFPLLTNEIELTFSC